MELLLVLSCAHPVASLGWADMTELPDILEPEEGFFHVDPVGGEFGITAELLPWQAIVDYQEKNGVPRQGYFRLCRHPYVRRLEARVAKVVGWPVAQAFCSPEAGLAELVDFLAVETGESPSILWTGVRPVRIGDYVVGTASLEELITLDSLPSGWTHVVVDVGQGRAGVVVTRLEEQAAPMWDRLKKRGATLSARVAAELCGMPVSVVEDRRDAVLDALNAWEGAAVGFLYPTGMAALVAAFEALLPEGGEVVVVGHLYSDTHVLLGELPWAWGRLETTFLAADESDRLGDVLTGETRMVFVESLTNPLIEVPDLEKIIQVCVNQSVPIVVDSTMATPVNCRPMELGADVVVHSTTKYFSGTNHHGGGAVLLREDGDVARRLAENQRERKDEMSVQEAAVLYPCLADFPERMRRFNANGEVIAKFLREHPAVGRVYYPEELPSFLQGAGSVVSFTLADESLEALIRFYETPMSSIRMAPTLGSDETLLCPYTLLTYYHRDEEYLEQIRLPRMLLRIAVGSEEDLSGVIDDLQHAFAQGM